MLLELYIKDIALIDEIRIPFEKGFSALTGETGAGKSIILGALNLVLGERVKGDVLPEHAKKGTIEALFDSTHVPSLSSQLETYGIELEEDEPLILRREISRQGNHRNYVNNRSVPLTFLKELGNRLIDFHGQHEHQSLFHIDEQLNLLDRYAKNLPLRKSISDLFEQLHKLKKEQSELKKIDLEKKERIEFLSFQIEEISAAELKEDEEEVLDQERGLLAHSEKIRESLSVAVNALSEGEVAASLQIGESLKHLNGLIGFDEEFLKLNERLQSVQIELNEISSDLSLKLEGLESDPNRLAVVEERLSLIWRLKKKYGESLKEVLSFFNEQTQKLEDLESASDRIKILDGEIETLQSKLNQEADKLTRIRKKVAPQLENKIQSELKQLGMKNCQFHIEFLKQEANAKGKELIEFFISPNLGDSPKPLRSIASGGEISRLMLALKVVFSSESSVPTMIFDEIDVNLGGGAAVVVGKKISELAQKKQVLVITHLPQVASGSNQNYKVEKEDVAGRTQTSIRLLTNKEKIVEIARMLRGEKVTDLALEHAKELIQGN